MSNTHDSNMICRACTFSGKLVCKKKNQVILETCLIFILTTISWMTLDATLGVICHAWLREMFWRSNIQIPPRIWARCSRTPNSSRVNVALNSSIIGRSLGFQLPAILTQFSSQFLRKTTYQFCRSWFYDRFARGMEARNKYLLRRVQSGQLDEHLHESLDCLL